MDFANQYEIETWIRRFAHDPVLLSGALTLQSLADGVNSCTDGWSSWAAPCKSAQKMIALLRDADAADRRGEDCPMTEADLKLAYRPIKAFVTRNAARYGFSVDLYLPAAPPPPLAGEPLTLFA